MNYEIPDTRFDEKSDERYSVADEAIYDAFFFAFKKKRSWIRSR